MLYGCGDGRRRGWTGTGPLSPPDVCIGQLSRYCTGKHKGGQTQGREGYNRNSTNHNQQPLERHRASTGCMALPAA
eukprot:2504557-Prymnesium_polylepis.1